MKHLIPLLLFSVSTTLTPGPNNLMIMHSGMYFGIKKSIPHYLGVCFGFPLMVLIVAIGLGALLMQSYWLTFTLKILGSIYMLYLAWKILNATNDKTNINETRKPWFFLQAVIFQWINPKAWLMAVSTTSLFTLTSSYLTNAFVISAIYFAMCVPCIGIWLLFGKFLQKILTKDHHRLWFNIAMALGLVASIGMIIFD